MDSSQNLSTQQRLEQWRQYWQQRGHYTFMFGNVSGKTSVANAILKDAKPVAWIYRSHGGLIAREASEMQVRQVHGLSLDGAYIWNAREVPEESVQGWLSTSINSGGLAWHRNMRDVIQFYLAQFPDTYAIDVSWSYDRVIVQELVPGKIADLAVEKIERMPKSV